jgi:arylformamidase
MTYRGMDHKQLDAAYNNTAAVPERTAIYADWVERSAAVRRRGLSHLDLAYGNGPRQRLDLFLAPLPKAPTLAFIHGGYWQMNDRESFGFLAEGALAHRINFVEYALAPAVRLGDIVEEIRRAIGWLGDHLATTAPMRTAFTFPATRREVS